MVVNVDAVTRDSRPKKANVKVHTSLADQVNLTLVCVCYYTYGINVNIFAAAAAAAAAAARSRNRLIDAFISVP